MNIEQERAEFEVWAEENLSDGIGRHSEYAGMYSHRGTQVAWTAWQARAALQSQHRGGYAGVTVWVDGNQCTKVIPKTQYENSNADELLMNFESARLAIYRARIRDEGDE